MVRSVTLDGRPFSLFSAYLAKEEFFLGLGPWPNIYIGIGSLVRFVNATPTTNFQNFLHYIFYFIKISNFHNFLVALLSSHITTTIYSLFFILKKYKKMNKNVYT